MESSIIDNFGSLYKRGVTSPGLLPSLVQPMGLHHARPPPLPVPSQLDALPPSPPIDTRVEATLDVASEQLVKPSAPPVIDSLQVQEIFTVRIFVDALFYTCYQWNFFKRKIVFNFHVSIVVNVLGWYSIEVGVLEEDNTLTTDYISFGKLFPPIIMIFPFVLMSFNFTRKNLIKPLLFVQSPERRTTPRPRKTRVVGSSKRRKINFDEVANRGDGGGGQ